ncbi:hypothetical protein BURPS305_5054 [Burkholderia pseudomallei 305]|nr:hypothetical protein BURPS305_5054 [Burkholderia pseudomallei 305]
MYRSAPSIRAARRFDPARACPCSAGCGSSPSRALAARRRRFPARFHGAAPYARGASPIAAESFRCPDNRAPRPAGRA